MSLWVCQISHCDWLNLCNAWVWRLAGLSSATSRQFLLKSNPEKSYGLSGNENSLSWKTLYEHLFFFHQFFASCSWKKSLILSLLPLFSQLVDQFLNSLKGIFQLLKCISTNKLLSHHIVAWIYLGLSWHILLIDPSPYHQCIVVERSETGALDNFTCGVWQGSQIWAGNDCWFKQLRIGKWR